MPSISGFDDFFKTATGGLSCFPYQRRFADASDLPILVNVPTGLGKTAAAVIGWLWRRQGASQRVRRQTPRRLVYCLPMRVLVEQTADCCRTWIGNLREAGAVTGDLEVYVLMGGEDEADWDIYPEREAIIIGTQDMLLSRALNRGYAASRSRWPMQFGLLHTDCLWVFDEIQLMGSGLATTAQLEAFRRLLGARDAHGCHSVWMSATLDEKWLQTVDFKEILETLPSGSRLGFDFHSEIATPGIDPEVKSVLKNRWTAAKPLSRSQSVMGNHDRLAREIFEQHHCQRGLTLVVVNTVDRAQKLFGTLRQHFSGDLNSRLVLLHSRFRPPERKKKINDLLNPALNQDMICISTQVVEAGVDVDATTLFTELAPWASLVQRFGRCNRRGERNEQARVFWIGLPEKKAEVKTVAPPYHEQFDDLSKSSNQLKDLRDVGIKSLPKTNLPFEHTHVIRRRDLIDLFDTTPDLAGNDIDIDRYVREVEDSDVRVFWRAWNLNEHKAPPHDKDWRRVGRDELCPVPAGSRGNPGFREFARRHRANVWRWDFLVGKWQPVDDKRDIYPGQTYLVHAGAGGYDQQRGWIGTEGKAAVDPLGPVELKGLSDNAYDHDGLSGADLWQTIEQHTDDVCHELSKIITAVTLNDDEENALRAAARRHDWGKAHEVFQSVLPDGVPRAGEFWAKAPGAWKTYKDVGRPHFRHELASALGVLLQGTPIDNADRNLVAYLIAAHHGKVRLSIRSLPGEKSPDNPSMLYARGVWEGDGLPEVQLGGGVTGPNVTLSLECMQLGRSDDGRPSWAERMLRLRDRPDLGCFRLAYLEALLRAADMRASRNAVEQVAESREATP